jgi:oligo-1,6-glucosidase/alpha-glucosidase
MKYTVNHPGNFELAKGLRAACREVNPDAILIGEVFGDTATLRQYLGDGDGLNYVFLFEMLPFKLNAGFFREKIRKFEQLFPAPFMPTYVFGNHDRIRPITRVKGDMEKWKLVALFQLTARGLPVIYMGEEIGMEQRRFPMKTAKDPMGRKYSWIPEWVFKLANEDLNRDGCRIPMQWNAQISAGFSATQDTWLPVHPDYIVRNVEAETQDPNSLLNWYRQILDFRQKLTCLQDGKIELLATGFDGEILAYRREDKMGSVRVYINFSDKAITLTLEDNCHILTATAKVSIENALHLPPWSGCLLMED